MVGVPGRSKGCNTCRRRKKGCDMDRPTCQRCKKSGLVCEGYNRDRQFVNESLKRDSSGPKLSAVTINSQECPWLEHFATTSNDDTKSQIVLADSLVKTAREQLYMGQLRSTMLPQGGQFSSEAWRLSAPGWAGLITEFYDTEPSLKYVTFAMAMGCLATQSNDGQLRVKSLQTYNMAVHELSTSLQKRDAYKHDGLIIASGLMASFELIFCPIDEPRLIAWKNHTDGQMAFFLNRGPEAFVLGSAHILFVDSRINLAMLAIGKRKKSPFTSHEWKTVPWAAVPKSQKDRLMDVMLEVPTLLEQMTEFQSCSCPIMAEICREQLLSRCLLLERAMRVWAAKMGTEMLRFDFTFVGEPIPPPQKESEFILLHLSIVHWFIEMMLFSIKSFASKATNLDASEARCQLRKSATKSAHALPLLFESSSGLAQNITGLLALSIALRYFTTVEGSGPKSEELNMLENLLDRELNGSSIGVLLTRMNGGRHPCSTQTNNVAVGDPENVVRWF